ncbi:MAG TPA: GGDEF domain-containing protein [Pseudonocardiaceae bacterium]|nr:GGDEF domain-containing protein [Pseudonocardiaceae bacterium]
MGTREVSPQSWRGGSARAFHALRARWRTASLASGWPFPTDWAVAEVDLVCEAVLAGADPDQALVQLGRARAAAGSGLGETLQDVAALHAALTVPEDHDGLVSADPDATPARLLRVTAMAWSDVLVQQLTRNEVYDGLTGLANSAYLRARLREIYRAAAAGGFEARSRYVLVVVDADLGHTSGWSRLAAMVLLADVLHTAFDGGQTLATIGPATMVVLAERDGRLSERAAATRWLTTERLGVDPQLRQIGVPSVRLEQLPATHENACRLVAELAKAPGH